MSCDHQFMTENIFDFLEGKLAPALSARCEAIINECTHCAASCEEARKLYHLGENWQDTAVPAWHRTRYAVKPPVRESYWISWAALTMSCFAIVLVVFQLEISTEGGLTISFGGGQSERRMAQELAATLASYRDERDVEITSRLAEFAERQNIDSQLMLNEWANTTREERRDDMNFILSAWENQRFQDQRQISRRFDTLASSQIESDQFINDLARNVNFRPRGITP